MTRLMISGPLAARPQGRGLWQLTTRGPIAVDIFLRGVEPRHAELLGDPTVTDLELTWHAEDVRMTLTRPTGAVYLNAQTAIVHEARERLYHALPLAGFDDNARRFWARIFRLMRIPGGRLFLRLAARRNR